MPTSNHTAPQEAGNDGRPQMVAASFRYHNPGAAMSTEMSERERNSRKARINFSACCTG